MLSKIPIGCPVEDSRKDAPRSVRRTRETFREDKTGNCSQGVSTTHNMHVHDQ